jgi:hypothetical protein
MAKAILSTEIWNTSKGKMVKAVARDTDGKFLGATNQTKAFPVKASRSRVTLVGR